MAKFDLKAYARHGAAVRVAALNEELAQIYRAFPELRRGGGADGSGIKAAKAPAAKKRKRRKMTAAQRAEISKRMKKRWAAVKKAGETRLG